MEDKELIELYKQRNEFAKAGDINQTENITNLINQELPTKITKRGFRDSNGNPVQFEILGFFNNYNPKTADINSGQIYGNAVKVPTTKSLFRGPVVNGKAVYFRILIKRR